MAKAGNKTQPTAVSPAKFIDMHVLREMVEDGVAYMRKTCETWDA